VLCSFAWEDAGDSFECHNDYNVEAGSFSYTPEAEPIVQNNMEAEVHSDRGVEPELHVADAREEVLVSEGDRSVVSSAPETREEGDVVLNKDASVDLPTLPSTEVLNESSSKVLSQAPVEN
jgi:hypothetical protein